MRRLAPAVVLLFGLVLPAAAVGSTVYFTRSGPTPGLSQIWSVPASGGKPRLLHRKLPDSPEGGVAALSRDGRRIFCICRKDEVDSVRTDGTHFRRVGSLPQAIRYDVVTLDPGGRAYWVRSNKTILSAAPGARRPRAIPGATRPEVVIDERVVPSPDGRRIAYIAYNCLVAACNDDDLETLLTAKVDGSDRTVVYQSTGEGKEIQEVAWSADGRKLLFADGTGEGDPKGELPVFFPTQYLVAEADGSNPQGTPVTIPHEGFHPFFAPGGDRVAFTYWSRPSFVLGTVPLAAGEAARLARTGCRYLACIFPPRVFAWR